MALAGDRATGFLVHHFLVLHFDFRRALIALNMTVYRLPDLRLGDPRVQGYGYSGRRGWVQVPKG